MTTEPGDILSFWLEEVGEKGWYAVDADLDARILARFRPLWETARGGHLDSWSLHPQSSLALIVLLDQFPRNMFRGEGRAFASDHKALTLAKAALSRGFDRRVAMPARQFFYLPLMHSECVADQERAVRLFKLHGDGGENLSHARAHRAVIRRFGRFPYRNDALGRRTSRPEAEWLATGGYTQALAEVA